MDRAFTVAAPPAEVWPWIVQLGEVVPDYGRRDGTFAVARIEAPSTLVYTSRRGRTDVSWSIVLEPARGGTRVALRLRLGPVEHVRLATTAGELVDVLTIAAMAAGLRERLAAGGRR